MARGRKAEPPERGPWRWVVVGLCFLAMLLCYVDRVGFSIAFTRLAEGAGVTEAAKGRVMSAFFWGYAATQLPGGVLAHRFGGHRLLALSFGAWGALALTLPLRPGALGLLGAWRAAVGVAQGLMVPSVHATLALWVPPGERSTAVSLTTSGMYLGSALAMLALPGVAAARGPAAVTAGCGAAALAWAAAWLAAGARGPAGAAAAPRGRPPGMPPAGARDGDAPGLGARVALAARMLRVPAVLAICANNFAFHYTLYLLMQWLPTFFGGYLGAPLAGLGWAKAVPYLVMFGTSNAGGWAGDWMIRRGWGVAAARKALNSAGMAGATAACVLLPAAGGPGAALGLAAATFAFQGLSRAGFSVNHMDVAPRYAPIVMGLSNTFGTVAGIVGVALTGEVVGAAGGAGQAAGWAWALAVAGAGMLGAGAVFLRHARGDVVVR